MEEYDIFKKKMKELDISFEVVEHPPALTTEEADSYIVGIEGVRTKTMFLTNKKKTNFYLIIMDEFKRLNMNKFKEIVNEKQIKMASEEVLFNKMKLKPGVVSPFGVLNNSDRDVQIFIDKDIVEEERMSFHPNTNEKTVFVATKDLFKFLENMNYKVSIIEL